MMPYSKQAWADRATDILVMRHHGLATQPPECQSFAILIVIVSAPCLMRRRYVLVACPEAEHSVAALCHVTAICTYLILYRGGHSPTSLTTITLDTVEMLFHLFCTSLQSENVDSRHADLTGIQPSWWSKRDVIWLILSCRAAAEVRLRSLAYQLSVSQQSLR